MALSCPRRDNFMGIPKAPGVAMLRPPLPLVKALLFGTRAPSTDMEKAPGAAAASRMARSAADMVRPLV
jgi:hypothetical protein